MKKFFLFSLLTLMCSVMAWGTTRTAGTFQQLQDALDAAAAGDVIELTADITYDGAWKTVSAADLNSSTTVVDALCITKSITLDGKGHKIVGWGKHDIGIGSVNGKFHGLKSATTAGNSITESSFGDVNTIHRVSLAIHPADANAAIDVVVKNISVGNETINKRYFGIIAFDGVDELNLDNVTIKTGAYGSQQGLCFTGANSTPIRLTMSNSEINVGPSAYATYFLKPFTGTISNTTIDGWCALYFKNRNIPVYGAVVGTRGSNVTCDACTFICKNVHNGVSNSFAMFPLEDDGITLTLNNCSMNPEKIGDQAQSLVSVQAMTRTSDYQPIVVNITGDNTHIYSIGLAAAIKNNMAKGDGAYRDVVTGDPGAGGNGVAANVPLTINITGGTFTVNPAEIAYPQYDGATWGGTTQGVTIDYTKYEVNEVSQGGNIVYRVVKKAATYEDPTTHEQVLYDLNDAVETAAEGENPITSFELSAGGTMTLDEEREVTTAGYVQVKDGASEATVVKVGTTATADPEQKVDQTLVINNGLDVQGDSKVEVQAGSALVIGEGGIVTAKPENIVIEADKEGAASLLLHPAITVNQTPELTVKMTAKQIGKVGADYFWHRFAMPVDAISSLPKDPSVTTKIFGWDYETDDWKSLSALSDLKPFYGYTLTTTADRQDVTYTFQGHLVGNLNTALNFTSEGYNFFGNSYTGYIDIVALADQLLDHADIDAAIWVWNTDQQNYHVVTLGALKETPSLFPKWKREIAPMQTFILRLATPGVSTASTVVDYNSAIWSNPRYSNDKNNAPARKNAFEGNAIRMSVAANGMNDEVLFIEKANFSDEFDKGYDGTKYMNNEAINIYSTVNNENYSAVATDQIEGKTLTIETVNEVNYTISFDVVLGETEYALRDNATNKVIAIEEGASYEFAAQPNSIVEGRFEIVDRANVVTSIDNAQDNKANVKGIYTIMGQYVGENFDVLPTGVYVVDGVKIVK